MIQIQIKINLYSKPQMLLWKEPVYAYHLFEDILREWIYLYQMKFKSQAT